MDLSISTDFSLSIFKPLPLWAIAHWAIQLCCAMVPFVEGPAFPCILPGTEIAADSTYIGACEKKIEYEIFFNFIKCLNSCILFTLYSSMIRCVCLLLLGISLCERCHISSTIASSFWVERCRIMNKR